MGGIYSRLNGPLTSCSGSVTEIITGRKRKHDEIESDSNDEMSTSIDKSLSTPIKKKLLSTAQYIYKTFYVEEQNSDISVMALGKVWHLHKIYLCQSPYFGSMFNGSWRERDQKFLAIEIIDPKITLESLNVVFGSLYLDEVTLEPKTVVSVLATAALLQLEGLIEKCAEVMNSTINAETAIAYYDSAIQYGTTDVKKKAFDWLLINLLSFYYKNGKYLQSIGPELLGELIESPDLVVMQTEFAIYGLLKFWTYLRIHANRDVCIDLNANRTPDAIAQATAYFDSLRCKVPFLATRAGKPFVKPFQKLRLQHLINHPVDMKIILEDNIIPREWLNGPFMVQWNSLLRIDNSMDTGPVDCEEKIFYQTCLRCGRVLEDDGFQKWRWTGFNFGVDLVLISDIRTLSIKRHHRNDFERLLSLQTKRNIMIRVTIYSLNEQRQVLHSQTTGILSIQLDRNEESRLIYLDTELKYPVLISVNLLVTTPNKLPQPPPTPVPENVTATPDESVIQSNDAEISTIGVTKAITTNNNNNDDDYNANRSNDSNL